MFVALLALLACRGGESQDSPASLVDADGDGYDVREDCDDHDPDVHPGASDTSCDGVDEDCDGVVDQDAPVSEWFLDEDGDGYGASSVSACARPDGGVEVGGDCDDSEGDVHPDAVDVCNGVDDDCDGDVDMDGEGATWHPDADGDGYGDAGTLRVACETPTGWIQDDGDCDDTRSFVHPGLRDTCGDGLDADCDGVSPSCSLKGIVDATTADAWFRGENWNDCLAEDMTGSDLDVAPAPDADGHLDVLVTATERAAPDRRVYLLRTPIVSLGGLDPISDTAHATWDGWRNDDGTSSGFGQGASLVGDLDGNGYQDILIGVGGNYGEGQAYVFAGPISAGVQDASAPKLIIDPETPDASHDGYQFPYPAPPLGDIDGDGIEDFAVRGVYVDPDGFGFYDLYRQVDFFLGPLSSGEISEDDRDGRLGDGDPFPSVDFLAPAGDVNGDGHADVLVGAPYADGTEGSAGFAILLAGGPVQGAEPISAREIARFEGQFAGENFGFPFRGGDLDGDGYADPAFGAPGYDYSMGSLGRVAAFAGPTYGTYDVADATWTMIGSVRITGFGDIGDASGDFNGDGIDDLALTLSAAQDLESGAGAALVEYGPLPTISYVKDADYYVRGVENQGRLGSTLAVGDMNEDGVDDLVLGSGGSTNFAGAIALFFGAP